jgi:hypothetical protein
VLAVVMTLAALSVAAQTHITSSVSARALHSQTGAPDYFKDSDYAGVEGAGPFGRLRVSVDSDGDAQIYNAAASAWAQVSTGGVHAYTRSQSNSSTVEQTWTHSRGEAMGLIDDSFALLVSGVPVGTLFNVAARVRVDGNAWATALSAIPELCSQALFLCGIGLLALRRRARPD